MVRPGCDYALTRIIMLASLCLSAACACRTSEPIAKGVPEEAESLPSIEAEQTALLRVAEAERLVNESRYEEAETILRNLVLDAQSPEHQRASFLKARIAQARAEPLRASLYLEQLLASAAGPMRFPALLLKADIAYEARDYETAYRAYLEALNAAPAEDKIPARLHLRLTEIALYQERDVERARGHMPSQPPGELTGEEEALWKRLKRRLQWRELSPRFIGLDDGNVSALQIDGDDLWIGTWNGGVVRFSLGSGERTIFLEGRESLTPGTVRCIEVTPTRIWVGTYQGLYAYSKATARWQKIPAFAGAAPMKVEALKEAGRRLHVGTLGDGLWRQEGDGWVRIAASGLPGDFINCLEVSGGKLLIGTLSQGLVLMDLAERSLAGFDTLYGGLEARNITMLLAESPEMLWIGTYGQGLYRWNWTERKLNHYSRQGGQVGDDWILCGLSAQSGIYFGTLGGGVARFRSQADSWEVLGLKQGLSSLDISDMAYDPPLIFLGTLGTGVSILAEDEGL